MTPDNVRTCAFLFKPAEIPYTIVMLLFYLLTYLLSCFVSVFICYLSHHIQLFSHFGYKCVLIYSLCVLCSS